MIILGIDPGTTRIGFGIIETSGNNLRCLHYGTFGTPKMERLENIREAAADLNSIIRKFCPEAAAVEKLFFFKNQKTVMAVGEMRGAILLTLAQNNIPVHEFTPLEVKKIVSGYGGADKRQVQSMAKLLLKLAYDIKPDDAADALAIAICCSTRF